MLNTEYPKKLFNLLHGTYEEVREVYQPNSKFYKVDGPTGTTAKSIDYLFLNPRQITESAQVDRQTTKAIDEAKANPQQKQSRDLIKHKINITI